MKKRQINNWYVIGERLSGDRLILDDAATANEARTKVRLFALCDSYRSIFIEHSHRDHQGMRFNNGQST